MPAHFSDQSYRHDVCPHFVCYCGKRQIVLWIDFEEPYKRELSDAQRYTLEQWDQIEWLACLIETDSEEEITEFISSYEVLMRLAHGVD